MIITNTLLQNTWRKPVIIALALLAISSMPAITGHVCLAKDPKTVPVPEASALVESRKQAGVFWTISDSGNPPILFAIDRTGKLLAQYPVKGGINADWEAIALDEKGRLYIGDVGNNAFGLPTRWVYQVAEPELGKPASDKGLAPPPVSVEKSYLYSFPDKPFDVEAMFFHADSLYLISKVGAKHTTKLYRLPLDRPGHISTLVEVCSLPGVSTVTGADLSHDGKRLAVCSYTYAAVFEIDPKKGLEGLGQIKPNVVRYSQRDVEACAWDGDDLLFVTESGHVYRMAIPPPSSSRATP